MKTPTKEQAVTASRKRLYTQSLDGLLTNASGGIFIQNLLLSHRTHQHMNKTARLNSPESNDTPNAQAGPAERMQLGSLMQQP